MEHHWTFRALIDTFSMVFSSYMSHRRRNYANYTNPAPHIYPSRTSSNNYERKFIHNNLVRAIVDRGERDISKPQLFGNLNCMSIHKLHPCPKQPALKYCRIN